jgi:hypothetical protein
VKTTNPFIIRTIVEMRHLFMMIGTVATVGGLACCFIEPCG